MKSLNIKDYNDNIPSVITVGTFDGIHLGHRKLIEKVLDISESENLRSIVLNALTQVVYSKCLQQVCRHFVFDFLPHHVWILTMGPAAGSLKVLIISGQNGLFSRVQLILIDLGMVIFY